MLTIFVSSFRPCFSLIRREFRNSCRPGITRSNTNLLVSAVLIPSGLGFIFAGMYIWLTYSHATKDGQEKHIINDPEFTGFKLVRVHSPYLEKSSSTKWCLPEDMFKAAEEARIQFTGHLHVNDVFVASYPKSGTTWLSELVYLLINKLNWEESARSNLEERVPFMEYIWPGPTKILETTSPRVIKTHLPFSFLPEEVQNGRAARVVYIVRDPRDVVVSYYQFARCFVPSGYRNLEKIFGFSKRFLEDRLPYSPWDEHVKTYLQAAAICATSKERTPDTKFCPKVLIIQYESLKSDPVAVVRKIESFLLETWTDDQETESKKPVKLTDAQIEALVRHCSFDQMSKNPTTNFSWLEKLGLWSCKEQSTGFMRKGLVGDHESQLSPDSAEAIVSKASRAGLEWTLADRSQ